MFVCQPKIPDNRLLPFLQATDPDQTRDCLDTLLSRHAAPIISGILYRRWRVSTRTTGAKPFETRAEQDAQDVRGETIVRLLSRLVDSKVDPASPQIADFESYVSMTTYHLCDRVLRGRSPRRRLLQDRIEALLRRRPEFALWRNPEGRRVCGMALWRHEARPEIGSLQIRLLCENPSALHIALDPDCRLEPAHLLPLLKALFTWLDRPLLCADLLRLVIAFHHPEGLIEPLPVETNACDSMPEEADQSQNIEITVERRLYLRQLWTEICALPPRQRMALLLNLNESPGCDALTLWTALGIVTRDEIARALSLTPLQLARLWDRLPLSDARIARLLAVTPRQVIDLRKAARKRLQRHMRAY